MNDFVFKPDVDAFRLPTEAEWTFAANLSFSPEKSWNADNSDFKAHEVCTKKDENDFCDLLGNVTEWVNDWLGNFADTSVINFVGAPNGGSLGERVIKGGSFRSESSMINLYARGDVYEWVYVASQGWNPEYGWNSENSGHEIPMVADKKNTANQNQFFKAPLLIFSSPKTTRDHSNEKSK